MYTRCIHADCAMYQIKTVKNEEYKVSLNFFSSLDPSFFFPLLLWRFIVSILNELKKK